MRKFLHDWRIYQRKVVAYVLLLACMVASIVLAPVRNFTFERFIRVATVTSFLASITTIHKNTREFFSSSSGTPNHTRLPNAPTQHDVPPPPKNVSGVPTQSELPRPTNFRVIGSN